MTSTLLKTPLHAWHAARGARLVDFANWSMPVFYSSITDEHQATRQAVGLFDVSHMGRFRFTGADTARFLDGFLTRRVDDLRPTRIRYVLITAEDGGTLDDVLVYHLPDLDGTPCYWMVVNAGNREKIARWIQQRWAAAPLDVQFADRTQATAMIAVQGPRALALAGRLWGEELKQLKYYQGQYVRQQDSPLLVSRTGYTGEDGVELIVPAAAAESIWQALLAADAAAVPAGLGARDTLRLEAGMPLYGHELNEAITPVQAGLEFALSLEGRQFPGREVLVEQLQKREQLPQRIGLQLAGKRVPRQHHAILDGDGKPVGEVTSGTFSPTLQASIAMGYVPRSLAEPGTLLSVDIRGRAEAAQVVPLPFYRRQ